MNESGPSIDFPAVDTQYGVEQLETLLDRLSESADLPTALSQGLRYILGLVKRSGGFVIIQEPDALEPELWVVEGAVRKWLPQLDESDSPLRRVCQTSLNNSGLEFMPYSDAPLLIFPLAAVSGQRGILAVSGLIGTSDETGFLGQAGRCLGRMVVMNRRQSLFSEGIKIQNILEVIVSGFCSDLPLDQIQTRIISGICDCFRCEGVSIAIREGAPSAALVKVSLVEGEEWIKTRTLVSFQGILGECIQNRHIIRSNNIQKMNYFNQEVDSISGLDTTSILCVPLKANDSWFGALQLHNKKDGGFTPYDQSLLVSIADSLGNLFKHILGEDRSQSRDDNTSDRWEFIRSPDTLRSLVDNMPNPLYIVDQGYRLMMANSSRSRRFHHGQEQLAGGYCYDRLFQRSEPCPGCLVGESLYTGKNTSRVMREWDEDGTTQEWEVNTFPIKDERGQVVQAVVFEQDVTEKNRLEAIVAQSEKLAAVGQLAAGFAHEINNPLTVILANAQILLRELPKDSDWADAVDLIERAGSRALHVMQNVLNFARKEEYEFKPTDINTTIENALEMLKHELVSRTLELVFEPADDLPQVMASSDHLQSVWLNIILNAMDATTQPAGRIRVATEKVDHDIRITISDNGQGIAAENLKRIFDPFYTTKDPGRGTGLGLSVCHRTVKQHGGNIQVESLLGVGTTFTINLPVY